jgi:isoleucyl-tRNA synthetase
MGAHHAWEGPTRTCGPNSSPARYRQRFQNGFDCQGLWVEVEGKRSWDEKQEGYRKPRTGRQEGIDAKFVQLCKDRVMKYFEDPDRAFETPGIFCDWEHSYFTMSEANNYMIWHFLRKCHEHGWIYKGHESVPWCPRCETAISQHEMLTE